MGRGHDFVYHWPAALATLAFMTCLPDGLVHRLRQHPIRVSITLVLVAIGFAITTGFDFMTLAGYEAIVHSKMRYPSLKHICELPHVASLCVLLLLLESPTRGCTADVRISDFKHEGYLAKFVRFVARLGGGVC